METFVQLSCLLLCQPGQCSSYKTRGETFIYSHNKPRPGTHTHERTRSHAVYSIYKHGCPAKPALITLFRFIWHQSQWIYIQLLISCWQVDESFLSWAKYEDLRIYILASEEGKSRDCSSSVASVTVKSFHRFQISSWPRFCQVKSEGERVFYPANYVLSFRIKPPILTVFHCDNQVFEYTACICNRPTDSIYTYQSDSQWPHTH